jgi:hypothetical protein
MEKLAKPLLQSGAPARTLLPAALLAVMFGAGCAAPLSVKAAKGGDQAGLRAAMAQERASGKLDQKRVAEVAKAVAEREIRQATGGDAVARVEEARACWRPLSASLEERADRADDAGASAQLALLDGRANRPGDGEALLKKHATSPNATWRAVAARGAVGSRLGDARRKFFVDPDERVRLAALRAALTVVCVPPPAPFTT